MIDNVKQLLAFLTVIADVIIVVGVVLLIVKKSTKNPTLGKVHTRLSRYQYPLIFTVSLVATLGSLFYSEIAHYNPCVLCWYQRILMYPQVVMLYVASMRREQVLTPYLVALNIIGALIAGYHYLIQRMPTLNVVPCKLYGPVDCTKFTHLDYGYITIPMMALSAFVLNLLILLFLRPKKGTIEAK